MGAQSYLQDVPGERKFPDKVGEQETECYCQGRNQGEPEQRMKVDSPQGQRQEDYGRGMDDVHGMGTGRQPSGQVSLAIEPLTEPET